MVTKNAAGREIPVGVQNQLADMETALQSLSELMEIANHPKFSTVERVLLLELAKWRAFPERQLSTRDEPRNYMQAMSYQQAMIYVIKFFLRVISGSPANFEETWSEKERIIASFDVETDFSDSEARAGFTR